MEEQIRLIAERMRGMREVLEISPDQAAEICNITKEQYLEYESGHSDIPVGLLHRLARHLNFDLTMLLTGNEPLMHAYTLTRKDKGAKVERRSTYDYQALAGNFKNRKAEPFLVSVEPKTDAEVSYNSHPGQEFNYLIEGKLKLFIGTRELILDPGDSIYFDSVLPHGMLALENKPARFLAIIL